MRSEVNIKSIAEALGISISTVSRALHNNPKIGLRTRELVQQKAKELHYVPNPVSMYMKRKKTFVIGIIVPVLEEEFFAKVINTVEDFFNKHDYEVFVFQTRDDMIRQNKILELVLKYRIDGLLVSLAANTTSYISFKKVENFGIPVVFFDRVPRSYQCHKVSCDIRSGAVEVIGFLKSLNCKNIALLNGPSTLQASDERLNGYLMGLQKNKLKSSPLLIKSTSLKKEDVMAGMEEFLLQETVPDAIFAFNDYVALMQCWFVKGKIYGPTTKLNLPVLVICPS